MTTPPEVLLVANTLRVVAFWPDVDKDELLSVADQVELDWDGICCRLCEEVLCDESCPLWSVREGLDA